MYLKEPAGNGKFIITPLTEDNVFSICPVCGEEHQVSIIELTQELDFDLTVDVCCPRCTREIKEEGLSAVMQKRERVLAAQLLGDKRSW